MAGVFIQNLTRRRTASRAVFSAIAENVLSGWDISLVFVGARKARALNEKLRKKNYVPNVLSYVSGRRSGEIIICLSEAKKDAASYGMNKKTFVLYLFIHGLLHLKGWGHGVRMERCEKDLLKQHETPHRHRYRHRHISGKNCRS